MPNNEVNNQTQPVDCTQWWLRNGKTEQADGVEDLRYKSVPLALEVKIDDDLPEGGLISIQGWASTIQLDSYDDIVEPEAFRSSLDEFMQKGTMLFMHDWYGVPVGKFTIARIEQLGLWVEGYIINTSQGRDVAEALKHSILNALSIGFRIVKYTMDTETDIRTIHDLKLYEISIVHVGANPGALFSTTKDFEKHDCGFVTKSLRSLTASLGGEGANRKESEMADEKKAADFHTQEVERVVEKSVGSLQTSLDVVSGDVAEQKKNYEILASTVKQLRDKHEQVRDGLATSTELKEFVDKCGGDIQTLKESLDKVEKHKKVESEKMPFCDWKDASQTIVTMRNDDGVPLSSIEAKGIHLMQTPVKYEGERGNLLKNIRQLNDVVTLCRAYGMPVAKLKSFNMLKGLIGVAADQGMVDEEFKAAMYSTGTGVGDEWVPEQWSSELHDLFELDAVIASVIPTFSMPSNPYKWPIKSSRPTVYLAGEATTANPALIPSSVVGTSNITFNAATYAVNVPVAPQLVEDSIIAIAPEIRVASASALAHSFDSVFINGDDGATHMDNASTTLYASTAPEVYEDGFRRIAKTDSKEFNVQSATSGYGDGTAAFHEKDLRYTRKFTGKLGRPTECYFLTGPNGFYGILSMDAFSKPGTYGAGASYASGNVLNIDGSPLLISEDVPENLAATGLYTGSGALSVVIYFNATQFKVGKKREFTVEVDKEIQQQMIYFVTTHRASFQNMTPSSLYPVAVGFNVA